MKKFLIAVALLTGCLTAPDAPDSTTTSDDPAAQAESENSSSQDLSVPENFDMQAWLQTINPKTCSAPPSCNLLRPRSAV
jgi:curli biogenesis system outer membrane secretion channel CsgG